MPLNIISDGYDKVLYDYRCIKYTGGVFLANSILEGYSCVQASGLIPEPAPNPLILYFPCERIYSKQPIY